MPGAQHAHRHSLRPLPVAHRTRRGLPSLGRRRQRVHRPAQQLHAAGARAHHPAIVEAIVRTAAGRLLGRACRRRSPCRASWPSASAQRTPSIDLRAFHQLGLGGGHDGGARGPRLHRQGRLHHAGQRLSRQAGTRCCWPAPTRSTRRARQGSVPAGIPKVLAEVVHFVRFNDIGHLEELMRRARLHHRGHPARADPRTHPRARRPRVRPRRPATRARVRRPAHPRRDDHVPPARRRMAGRARHRGRPDDHGQDHRRRHAGRRLRRQGARHADPRSRAPPTRWPAHGTMNGQPAVHGRRLRQPRPARPGGHRPHQRHGRHRSPPSSTPSAREAGVRVHNYGSLLQVEPADVLGLPPGLPRGRASTSRREAA